MHVVPLAQTVGPVQPVPPHCPHLLCVGAGVALVVDDLLVVFVVVVVEVAFEVDVDLLVEEVLDVEVDLVLDVVFDEEEVFVLDELVFEVDVAVPFQFPKSVNLSTVGSLYNFCLNSRVLYVSVSIKSPSHVTK